MPDPVNVAVALVIVRSAKTKSVLSSDRVITAVWSPFNAPLKAAMLAVGAVAS